MWCKIMKIKATAEIFRNKSHSSARPIQLHVLAYELLHRRTYVVNDCSITNNFRTVSLWYHVAVPSSSFYSNNPVIDLVEGTGFDKSSGGGNIGGGQLLRKR